MRYIGKKYLYLYATRRECKDFYIPLLAYFFVVSIGVLPFWISSIVYSDAAFLVHRPNCKNSCFDTVFKGPYETGISGYKHVYFNCTWTTAKLWALTVTGILGAYELFKWILQLAFSRQLRMSMFILLAASFHSHLYGWWNFWNHLNDDFYDHWNRQLFFSLTEMTASAIVIYYLDKKVRMQLMALALVANISIFHICASGVDQFVINVLFTAAKGHQVLRDVLLMLSDILHTGISLYLFNGAISQGESFMAVLFSKKYLLTMLAMAVSLFVTLICVPRSI